MPKLISVDTELYKIIIKVREQLKKQSCSNPSFSNAVRTLADLPHISSKSRIDTCNKNARQLQQIRVSLSVEDKTEKELE